MKMKQLIPTIIALGALSACAPLPQGGHRPPMETYHGEHHHHNPRHHHHPNLGQASNEAGEQHDARP